MTSIFSRWGARAGFVAATFLLSAGGQVYAQAVSTDGLAKQFTNIEAFEAAGGSAIAAYHESPKLTAEVEAGKLPPVAERLPMHPAIVRPAVSIGEYGGMLSSPATVPNQSSWDTLEMRIQPMLTYDTDYKTIIPNIAESFDLSEDGKTITLKLREGMKWSDGEPVTTDDVQFFYDRVLTDTDVTPAQSADWSAGGELVKFERVDDYTFKWVFAASNPAFLAKLATERAYTGIVPKHYLERFHLTTNPDAEKLAKEQGYDNWKAMMLAKLEPYTYTWYGDSDLDPGQPTIETYVYSSIDSSGNKTFTRNPYYFKVDTAGNQLPYVDGMHRLLVANIDVQELRAMAGDYTHFGWGALANYTTYKKGEAAGGYRTNLLEYLRGNEITFAFNVTHPDPIKREVFGNLKFREAMSVAINRDEINKLVYFGKAKPRQAVPVPNDSFYEDWMEDYYAQYDTDLANKLLDEAGLDKRDGDGFRLGPDGKPFTLEMIEGAPEPAWVKSMELVAKYWNEVGVRTQFKMIQTQLFREQRKAGQLDVPAWAYDVSEISIWAGSDLVRWVAPYADGAVEWRTWIDSNGEKGTEPPEDVKQAAADYDEMLKLTLDDPKFAELGKKVFTTQIKNLYVIGTVGLPPQPVLTSTKLQNSPDDSGLWSWTYRQWVQFRPEQFWLKQ
ncbi:ABC transporter substrate-binding protein [Devosia rhodophyticola]|uniref:ABC transporter substrate-binding protein n=1 Tax=Devosia rhodophyticola TaxID=3026423 RepID=A0ABY7YTW9_9HYPH|nr:ABC transporter substrate-binding protein [Devosia rhodophyticola]WDR04793.1 ABC transporter substrate-binding protein [Devosia rhodophyticola]